MYFLDELDNLKLYRRTVLLPIDETDKRHHCAAFILGCNKDSFNSVMRSALLVPRYYTGYYTERAVLYYVNQENQLAEFDGEVIEEVNLYDEPLFPISITYNGYTHNIDEVKKYLKKSWFDKTFGDFNINKKYLSDIQVDIRESVPHTNPKTIYLLSYSRYRNSKFCRDFKSYEKYCKFNALMWCFYCANPHMNEWLCMGLALVECGVAGMYTKRNWPFNYNLGVLCRAIENYKRDNTEGDYINKVIKGPDGISRLNASINDIISLFGNDTMNAIRSDIIGETSIPIADDMGIVLEDKKYNTALKKILFADRIKTNKELLAYYKEIKQTNPEIKYTYNNIGLYNKLNVFVDLSSYSQSFIKNSTFKKVNGAKIYIDLLNRLLNDKRFENAGYTKQTIIIPIYDWVKMAGNVSTMHLINNSINPISCIFSWFKGLIHGTIDIDKVFGDRDVLFLGQSSFMKINFSTVDKSKMNLFLRNIRHIAENKIVMDIDASTGMAASMVSSARAIKTNIVDRIETSRNIKIDNFSVDDEDEEEKPPKEKQDTKSKESDETKQMKKELVKAVDKAAKGNATEDDALETIDSNEQESEKVKQILSDLATNPDDRGSDISGARASRMLKLQNDFLDSELRGKKIKDIIETDASETKVKPIALKVDSVNPEWNNLTFAATIEAYNLDDDIVKIFNSFMEKSNPLVVRELTVDDTSTSDDLIYTYTCKYESAKGERFTIKVDIPKFIDNKYMVLRGNRKTIPIQLFLMPIIKTEENAVQIVSCYKKIFVRRFGANSGKSNPVTDKLIKALDKGEYKHIKITSGDNEKVCSKYELPIDYIDLACSYSKIETVNYVFMFNQDEVHNKLKVDDKKGLCIGYNKKDNTPIYYSPDPKYPFFLSLYIYDMIQGSISTDKDTFRENYENASTSVRYCYSRASILDTDIPLVVICGLAEGLEKTMRKAGIKYDLSEKRPKIDHSMQDIIKFKDGYLTYELNYASCLLMNGLKACNTEDYSITAINSRIMYLDFLDMFGGRIKSDGLDNFQDCMIDPITAETLRHYKLPTDYVDVLLYANFLLSDNKFVKHGSIRSTRRLRRMEQVASYLYEVLCRSYAAYSTGLKHGRNIGFSIKQSAVIDRVLIGNTTDDQSILNALGEYEAYNTVTPKGPSGMNSDRGYTLDKRSYDESMLNILSASTGFAGNVGISRQATIDASVDGVRGYITNDPDSNKDEVNSVKTLCMTEALTPFGSTRDDPMRLAMGFIQTQKHGMRCEKSDPLLISNGADEALPYLISNTFAYKAKENGKVVEITDEYMIIEYKKPIISPDGKETTHEYINLAETVQKNSSSGFYVTLKLDTDLKVGKTFKAGDIIAYDKSSFSDEIGPDDNIAYNIGTLCKFAIMNTDEGFEDSAIISDSLSEALASDIVLEREITVPKDANVYNLVKKGQSIQEGDTLLILQHAYDEEDVNTILRNITDADEVTELGRIPITSKVTGVIQDIVIERTVDINELSPTLKKIVNDYEKDIKNKKKIMSNYGITDDNKTLPDTEALPAIGRLKKASDGLVIRIYMKYHDKFSVGCKLIYGTAVKGVAKDIFPKGLEPYSEYRPDEKIHTLLSIGSINARMVASVNITAGIYKGLIELSRKVKDMAGIKYDINLI